MIALADEFLLAAVDEYSGSPHLFTPSLDLGLAGALLAEQLIAGNIALAGGVLTARPVEHTVDHLGHLIIEVLSREYDHPCQRDVRFWLHRLARTSYRDVGERLVAGGLVRAVEKRRLLRCKRVRYVPVEPNTAAFHGCRVGQALAHRLELDVRDRTLAGLLRVTNLIDHMTWLGNGPRHIRALILDLERGLPGGLRQLLVHVDAAIGAHVMSGRR